MKLLDDNDLVRKLGHADFDPQQGLQPFQNVSIERATDSVNDTRFKWTRASYSPMPVELEIGSDVEVGHRTLELLREGCEPVIVDRGAFHRYSPASGLWQPIPRAEVERAVHRFDGLPYGADNRRFRANQARVLGAVARAAAIADHPDFFANAKSGIAFANGFLSVSSDGAVLLPHSPEHRASVGLGHPFDAEARAPRFERFLHDIFALDDDADAKSTLIQQFIGVSLVGVATRFQAALVLVGAGANGKSVLIDIVQSLFPSGATTSIPPQDFDQEYRRALLAGARLNAVSEMPEREVLESEPFKAIVNGDLIAARRIRESPFMFRPTAGHLFAANRLPGTTDQSHGFWRRFLPIELNRVFAPHEQDRNLATKIIADELSGVTAWAIDGAVHALEAGHYAVPDSVLKTREHWQRSSDQVRLFAEDRLHIAADVETAASALYGIYAEWAKDNGHRALASNKFFPRLMALELGIEKHRRQDRNYYTCEVRR